MQNPAISEPTTHSSRQPNSRSPYTVIAINTLVFPRHGGDRRLFTSTFLHFGIIHIAMNMYLLYQIGPFIEVSFGSARYLLIYFVAGLAGSVTSVWVHPNAVGAGASGAVSEDTDSPDGIAGRSC